MTKNSGIKIKSAKIVGEKTLTAYVVEARTKGTRDYVDEVHNDLKKRMQAMSVHLAVMCGYIPSEDVQDIVTGKVDDFFVRGYSVGKNFDGIMLMGHHLAPDGKVIILNTPFYRFEAADEDQYVFMDDLKKKHEKAEKEVLSYILENKIAVDPQMSLALPEENK